MTAPVADLTEVLTALGAHTLNGFTPEFHRHPTCAAVFERLADTPAQDPA